MNAPNPVLDTAPLGFVWETADPFLFCVHHDDAYPAGDARMAPDPALLRGRNLGNDFEPRDGWRMYHGQTVPGFPQHPHRGFETVTLARRGFIDHSDSLGATARFGRGDVQWMTAGRGIVHCEMFPLLNREGPNPAELFQIWLNLPADEKMVEPHFSMLWSESIPVRTRRDAQGRATTVTVIAGRFDDAVAPSPPPHSWAARPSSEVAIWTLAFEAHARTALPPASPGVNRTLYVFAGEGVRVGGTLVRPKTAVSLRADVEVEIENLGAPGEALMLQGRPIAEPVVAHGPFVMNTRQQIMDAFRDYQRTGFGGWPWKDDGPVHPRDAERFARHADGRLETRPR